MKRNIIYTISIFLAYLLVFSQGVNAQSKNNKTYFTGKVSDQFGNPVAGAEIRIDETDQLAVTNENGVFELDIYNPKAIVEVSCNGYKTIKQLKGDKMNIEITLSKDASGKFRQTELIYQKRPAYEISTSVVTIQGEELIKTPGMNLAAALAGRLPGLLCRQSSAEPGVDSYALSIRGIGTTNGRSPLVLVDGVPSSNLTYINPRDVASVTIFRDGAANALFGMQAGNGTISIITKTGDFGKPRIRFTVDQSFVSPIKTPQMISSYDYALLRNQAYKNDGYGDYFKYSESKIDGYKNGDTLGLFPNNNWYDYFMKPMVLSQRVNFSATGGFEGVKYYTSVGYSNMGSPFVTHEGTARRLDRIDFRSNVDVRLNKYINTKMKISGLVRRSNGSNVSSSDILASIFNIQPTVYGPLTPKNQVVATTYETNPTYGSINRNGYLQQTSTKMNALLGLDFDLSFITKGLSAEASAMFDAGAYSNINGSTSYERWIRDENRNDSLIFIKQGTQENTPLTLSKGVSSNYMANTHALLNYKRIFGKHSIDALAFVRYQHENHADLDIAGILPYQRLTYGGRISYGFSDMIFADLATSYEGSEQFAPENRFGLFPAASLSWVISNSDFLKDNKTITYLKARASFGVVGNDQFGNERFMYKDNISRTGTGFIAGLGQPIEEIQVGNRMLTWEKSRKSNVGIELGLWNQLSFGLDLYNENRSDILVNMLSTPASQGVPVGSLPMSNSGLVNNKGFELVLGYTKACNKNLSFDVHGYVDFNINKVIESPEVELGSDYAYPYRQKGYSMGQNWGYLIDKSNGNGYFNSAEEIVSSGLTYEGGTPRPGDFIYKDLNNDKIINQKDMAPMGNPTLPRISWGLTCNVKWREFDVYALLQGIDQVSQFSSGIGYYDYLNNGTYFEKHKSAWTSQRYAENKPISGPALSTLSSTSNRSNDYYLTDKAYARLKNVEIGYSLPQKAYTFLKAESIRFYLSGTNLLTFDRVGNNDVDIEMGGYTVFPTNRTLNVGLNITF